jgi:hypothetical protein
LISFPEIKQFKQRAAAVGLAGERSQAVGRGLMVDAPSVSVFLMHLFSEALSARLPRGRSKVWKLPKGDRRPYFSPRNWQNLFLATPAARAWRAALVHSHPAADFERRLSFENSPRNSGWGGYGRTRR